MEAEEEERPTAPFLDSIGEELTVHKVLRSEGGEWLPPEVIRPVAECPEWVGQLKGGVLGEEEPEQAPVTAQRVLRHIPAVGRKWWESRDSTAHSTPPTAHSTPPTAHSTAPHSTHSLDLTEGSFPLEQQMWSLVKY